MGQLKILAIVVTLTAMGCAPKAGEGPQPAVAVSSEAPAPEAPAAAPGSTVQLVETWPVETSLDNPEIPDAWEVWPELIDGAAQTLDISQFYIATEPGSRLEPTLAAVERAAERGVAVRVIGDAKFYKTYPETLDALGALDGIEVRIYDMGPLTGGVQHAKYFVVDGQRTFLGSQNWDWRSLEHIQELGVLIDDPGLGAFYDQVFELDWLLAGGADREAAMTEAAVEPPAVVELSLGGEVVSARAVASPEGLLPNAEAWDLPLIMGAIEGAQEHIRVQLLSFEVVGYDKQVWTELDEALRAAAGRGVLVELTVANWSKRGSKLEAVKGLAAVDGITVRFANIPEHSSGFQPFSRVVHSKLMTVDGSWAWVGTSNWSRDYFFGSRNVGLVLEGKAAGEKLDAYFDHLVNSEYVEVVDPEADYTAPRTR